MQVTRETQGGETQGSPRVLFEREPELEAVERALERLESGRGRALIVRGAPGVGRSSLLSAIRERAQERGIGQRYSEAAPSESGFPYALIKRLLLPAPDTGPLSAALERLPGSAPEPGRSELGAAVEALREQVVAGPQVLLVDEAQWADPESQSCLEAIVRRLEEIPALIVLAVPDAGPGSADEWLLGVERSSASRSLSLGPLSVPAGKAMIEMRLETQSTDNFASACHRVSGGNPFILGELISTLRSSEVEPVDASIFELETTVPPGVRNLALDRLAPLAPECVRLAEAAVVLGAGSALEDAARLAELETGDAERAADELVAAEILGLEVELEPAQPLVGRAIYERSPRTVAVPCTSRRRARSISVVPTHARSPSISAAPVRGLTSGWWTGFATRRVARGALRPEATPFATSSAPMPSLLGASAETSGSSSERRWRKPAIRRRAGCWPMRSPIFRRASSGPGAASSWLPTSPTAARRRRGLRCSIARSPNPGSPPGRWGAR